MSFGMALPTTHASPPYPPRTALTGCTPTPRVDIPICTVFILLFLLLAAWHMIALQLNLRGRQSHEHQRLLPTLIFIFCVLRIAALSLRIACATYPNNLRLAIAALVFTMAGVVLLLIVNLFLAKRLIRDYYICTKFGAGRRNHHAPIRILRGLVFCVVACLLMVISAAVDSFFVRTKKNRQSARDVQLVATTLLTFLAFVPFLAVIVLVLYVKRTSLLTRVDSKRRFWARCQLLFLSALLLTLEIGFRCGVGFDARPVGQPAWFHSRASFYCFTFLLEVMMVALYGFAWADRRLRIHHQDNIVEGTTSSTTTRGKKKHGREHEGGHDERHGWVKIRLPEWHRLMGRVNTTSEVFGEYT
ncbi:hypothetical protein B0H66DRAFT_374512 [Apodospora peruviana]|uniref:Uncharacterized protein n=1 Tax=Apodospora peruviana TaxID=516989 RepID=A0AAE0HWU5_9PEZI|nr:hypothetical protein B0H66DRAFT_374512 [Apodospora peruviana]